MNIGTIIRRVGPNPGRQAQGPANEGRAIGAGRHPAPRRSSGRAAAQVSGGDDAVCGFVAPGFEPVHAAFRENFLQRGEIGAACAVYYRGEKVVDLWGGQRAAGAGMRWLENTLVPLRSAAGALAAMSCAVAHSRGWLRYDRPVAELWPEFAQAGKSKITVRELLSHKAGLNLIEHQAAASSGGDAISLAAMLARQAPQWKPGSRYGYHAACADIVAEELLRRCDPQQRLLREFFAEELAGPLDAEVYAAPPAGFVAGRVALPTSPGALEMLDRLETMGLPYLLASCWPKSQSRRTMRSLDGEGLGSAKNAARHATLPTVGAVATARGLARLYSEFATGGKTVGLQGGTLAVLEQPPQTPWQGSRDMVLKRDSAYSLGFWKPLGSTGFGTDHRAYGVPRLGGGSGFADPAAQLGFAYLPNRIGPYLSDDPRELALRAAVYRCLDSV